MEPKLQEQIEEIICKHLHLEGNPVKEVEARNAAIEIYELCERHIVDARLEDLGNPLARKRE